MSRSLRILEKFKNGYIEFIDQLLGVFPYEPDLTVARIFFNDQIPVSVVARAFSSHILPLREKIEKRDESFFIENDNIFGMVDTGKVVHFKKLWQSPSLDDKDRANIWKWFDKFCLLIDAYNSEQDKLCKDKHV